MRHGQHDSAMPDQDDRKDDSPPSRLTPLWRLLAACGIAALHGLGSYLLLTGLQGAQALIGISFLFIQPAALASFVCYICDPMATRPMSFYASVPLVLVLGAIGLGGYFFQEGVICCLMLAPVWYGMGFLGARLTYKYRQRSHPEEVFSLAVLALPLAMAAMEPMITPPWESHTVARSAIMAGSPDQIWPLLRGIPDVRPGEGRWNITQDVLGVPRPLGARLEGEGIGAARIAQWQRGIRFAEVVDEWQPQRRIGWRFDFRGSQGWQFTDQHLRPDSNYFRVTRGSYQLDPVDSAHSRVTIRTTYAIRTRVNFYAALWGEWMLGDLEDNLLGLINQRIKPNRR